MESNGNSALETASPLSPNSGSPLLTAAPSYAVKVNDSVKSDVQLVEAVRNGRGGYASEEEVFEAASDKLHVGGNMTEDEEEDDDDEGEVFGSERRIGVGGGKEEGEDRVKFTSSGDAVVEDVSVEVVGGGEVDEKVVVVGNGEEFSLENGFEEISEDAGGAVNVSGESEKISGLVFGEQKGGGGSDDVVVDYGDGLDVTSEKEVGGVGDGGGDSGDVEVVSEEEKVEMEVEEEAREADTLPRDSIQFSDAAIGRELDFNGDEKNVDAEAELDAAGAEEAVSAGAEVHVNGAEETVSAKDSIELSDAANGREMGTNGGEKNVNAEAEVDADGGEEAVNAGLEVDVNEGKEGVSAKDSIELSDAAIGREMDANGSEKDVTADVEVDVDEGEEAVGATAEVDVNGGEEDVSAKDSIELSDAAIGREIDVNGGVKDVSAEVKVDADGGEDAVRAGAEVNVNGGEDDVIAGVEVDAKGGKENVRAGAQDNAEAAVTLLENDDDEEVNLEDGEIEGLETDEETEEIVFESSEAAKQFLEELERGSGLGAERSLDNSQRIDGQIATDSDEEVDTDEEGNGKELFDSAALAALLKAATGVGSDDGTISLTSQDGSRLFSVERPAGLGSSLRSLRPAARANRPNLFSSSAGTSGGASDNNLSDEDRKKLEKLQEIRVKFLRLIHRLGHSPDEATTSQVLYRLALVAGRQVNQQFSLEAARRTALQQEEDGKDDLDFCLNILVLGKTGVGKSATINSIFGEQKSPIHAFEPATDSVKEFAGVVDGMKIRVLDSPGLKSPAAEQGRNRKVLFGVKRLVKKFPPDIILYVDRLDNQTRDLNDMPLLRTITDVLGSSIWRSAIVTLTHAASAPPDGPSGSPLSYEVFVAQRSQVVQQSIGQACGDLRLMNPTLMNPVALVENHPSCRKNREGQKVLPNGQAWRSQLLLLCCSVKVLSEASSLSKAQDPFDHKKLFGFRSRSPPLPYLLSWLLQSRTHPRLPTDEGGDSIDSDVDLADLSDSVDLDEKDEYDGLPTFKPLRKNQLAKLTGEQKKAYLEEYDYRVKLLQKKQWKQELRRIREMKKKGKVAGGDQGSVEYDDADGGAPASVPVPLPDMVLPPSFDSDNPGYRYRFLEPTSQFLARPVLDSHGWDHDCGYDGVNVEQSLAVINQFPATIAVQVTKDKKEFNLHLDSSISAKHGDAGSSMAGFDIQNVGKQLAYVVRGETKFKNLKKNKTGAGVSVTFLGKNVATGVKVEDQISLGNRLTLVGSTGTVRSQGDAAYGANVEVRLRDADYPVEQDQSSLGLSLVKWRGDLALGANLQSQFSIGRGSKVAVRAGLNNKMSGQLTVKTSSSEQLQLALVGLLPIVLSIYKILRPGVADKYSMY